MLVSTEPWALGASLKRTLRFLTGAGTTGAHCGVKERERGQGEGKERREEG